ncbi:MAG TPA: DUF89 family protein [Thiomicrospira sp.]|jgi:uncharacterized protein with ATP-grasp and redox domains|nr:DUF89 family protein [Thiomicrospira sp.]
MKTYLDCYPCLMRQALQAARFANLNDLEQQKLMLSVMESLATLPAGASPPVIAQQIHRTIRTVSGNPDPYRQAKIASTEGALSWYKSLRKQIDDSEDPIGLAIKLSIAGNIIDFGIADTYDLKDSIHRVTTQSLAIDDVERLKARLQKVSSILYLGDNSGETVFDRLLIETLVKHYNLPVTYVVRGSATINDATYLEAEEAGLNQVCSKIIDNGSDAPGTLLEDCSKEFIAEFNQAELIIAKGQGNFESLSSVEAPLFFILQAKCNVIANELGVDEMSLIVKGKQA